MENILNTNELNKERTNYRKIFSPHGIYIDKEIDVEKYLKLNKELENKKSELIKKILTIYPLNNNEIVARWKKCLPNGHNDYYSIEDSEYELLKNEFKEI